MKLYEPRRCIGQRKNGTPCSFLSSSSFSPSPLAALALFTYAGAPRSTPESVRGQTVFFSPLFSTQKSLSRTPAGGFSPSNVPFVLSLSLSFPTRTGLLSSFSATLLIFN